MLIDPKNKYTKFMITTVHWTSASKIISEKTRNKAIEIASFSTLSPNIIALRLELKFNSLFIEIVATGSVADIKDPNNKASTKEKGYK